MNLKIKILIILLLWCFIPSLSWSFSFFSKKDVEYYKKHKDEAEDKLKACEMAMKNDHLHRCLPSLLRR